MGNLSAYSYVPYCKHRWQFFCGWEATGQWGTKCSPDACTFPFTPQQRLNVPIGTKKKNAKRWVVPHPISERLQKLWFAIKVESRISQSWHTINEYINKRSNQNCISSHIGLWFFIVFTHFLSRCRFQLGMGILPSKCPARSCCFQWTRWHGEMLS